MSLREPLQAQVDPSSPHVLVAVEGAGVVESRGMEAISFAKGEAVVIPAAVREYTVRPQWELEIMRMAVPREAVPPPVTTLHEFVSTP
jgi:mannose-6-phosphate isomerase class I